MSDAVKIEPNDIKFTAPYTRPVSSEVTVSNLTTDRLVAFKVKTVDPGRYRVRPTKAVLVPGAQTTIRVQLQPLDNPNEVIRFVRTKQKFAIQWVAAAASVNTAQPLPTVVELFDSVPATADSSSAVHERKLVCLFDGQSADDVEKSRSYKPARPDVDTDDTDDTGKLSPVDGPLVQIHTGNTPTPVSPRVDSLTQGNTLTQVTDTVSRMIRDSNSDPNKIIIFMAGVIVVLAILLVLK